MSNVSHDPATGPRALMLYDGLCGFCNWTVRWVMKHDRHDRFRFAPQQSPVAEEALGRHGIDRESALSDNSVYLILSYGLARERVLRRSDVTVEVLRLLGGGWALLAPMLSAMPRGVRDALYTLVARSRFRIAGRYASCPLPSEEERAKFLV